MFGLRLVYWAVTRPTIALVEVSDITQARAREGADPGARLADYARAADSVD